MNDMTTYKLGDIISVKHGYPFKSEYFADKGDLIVLTPGNFYESGGFKRIPGKEKYYTTDFPDEFLCNKGDLVVAMTEQSAGLLGSTAIIPENDVYLHNQRIGLISWRKDKADKMFLYYLFMSSSVRKQIEDAASGTKIKHTSPEKMYDVVVKIPELSQQRKIGSLLWSIDSKIQNNNKICAELESMAKTLYDYWFVQFDFPDADGRPYRTSGGAMVWSNELKREVPEGWGMTNIASVTRCHDSKRVPVASKDRDKMKGSIPYYGATEIMGYVNDYIFDGDYVLLAEDGSVMNKEGFPIIQRITGKTWVNNHAHVLEPLEGYSCRLLMLVLSKIPVTSIKTGSIQMKINQENLNMVKLIDIPQDIKERINDVLIPIDQQMLALQNENRELAALRDWLLPMLMNGQARVV